MYLYAKTPVWQSRGHCRSQCTVFQCDNKVLMVLMLSMLSQLLVLFTLQCSIRRSGTTGLVIFGFWDDIHLLHFFKWLAEFVELVVQQSNIVILGYPSLLCEQSSSNNEQIHVYKIKHWNENNQIRIQSDTNMIMKRFILYEQKTN